MSARAIIRIAVVSAVWFAGCTGTPAPPEEAPTPVDVEAENVDVVIPTARYALNADAGDPSVSAELGGPGFTGEGWTTRLDVSQLGNAEAPQGGELVASLPDWPATLRMMGKDWNQQFNYFAFSVLYMPLLALDPVTLEHVPALATHWKISEDGTTYQFRINPEATWSDGKPVVADDVVATWKIGVDPTLLDPSRTLIFQKYEEPRAISKYIVEVVAKEPGWRSFQSFAGILPFPAHVIGELSGKEYLDTYQNDYVPFSGPYEVKAEDIDKGNSIAVTRRSDWWAEDNPVYDGMYHLERIQYTVVKRTELAFEKVKKGELDYFTVFKAQRWAEEVPVIDAVQRGALVARRFYTDAPVGTQGIALNVQRPHLDDRRVRLALQHLFDRETMIKKLFFNEYGPITSYWQYGGYANPENTLYAYDEIRAVELLEEAGYTTINDEGYRTKDGKELALTLQFRQADSERYLTVFQESAKRAGVRLELQLLTPASMWKNVREKQYELAMMAWGALVFPNPQTSWHSDLASTKDNNNITAFASERVDDLIDAYAKEPDVAKRQALIQEIDGIIYQEVPYVLAWYLNNERILFWNKFGMPEPWATGRFDEYGGDTALFKYWWVDTELEQQMLAARADTTLTMDPGRKAVKFWNLWSAQQSEKGTATADVDPEAVEGEAKQGADHE